LWQEAAGLPVLIWAYTAAFLVAVLGLLWDGGWHASWGRDTFFIPPHNMLYTAVTLTLVLTYLTVVVGSLRPRDPALPHLGRLQAQPGIWGIFVGCLLLLGAAPFDELWHRTFGPDDGTGLWSPPHFVGMLGGLCVNLGILLLLRRAQPLPAQRAGRPPALGGLSANDVVTLLLLGFVTFIVGGLTLNFYAIRHWYRLEGTLYPLLTLLTGPLASVFALRVAGRAGAATVAVLVPFVFIGGVGAVLRLADYPIVVSLPVMAVPSTLVLDWFYRRHGADRRRLALAGLLSALVFYPFEFGWAALLNGGATWALLPTLLSLAVSLPVGAGSALAGNWLAGRFLRFGRAA